jgi:hypothetical protein
MDGNICLSIGCCEKISGHIIVESPRDLPYGDINYNFAHFHWLKANSGNGEGSGKQNKLGQCEGAQQLARVDRCTAGSIISLRNGIHRHRSCARFYASSTKFCVTAIFFKFGGRPIFFCDHVVY